MPSTSKPHAGDVAGAACLPPRSRRPGHLPIQGQCPSDAAPATSPLCGARTARGNGKIGTFYMLWLRCNPGDVRAGGTTSKSVLLVSALPCHTCGRRRVYAV